MFEYLPGRVLTARKRRERRLQDPLSGRLTPVADSGALIVDEELSKSLPLDETAPRRARELVEPLRAAIDVRPFEAIRQVVSELVGQCVREAHPDLSVVVRLGRPSDDLVEVEVSRPAIDLLDTPAVDSDDATTIAFQVVDRLVDEWGVREDTDQVTVWIRIHAAALTPVHHR